MIEQIKKCDIFGSPFLLRIQKNETEWRSIFGGVMSILIMLLSVSYIIYTFSLWYAGELPPTIVYAQESQDYVTIDKKDQAELVKFYFWNYKEGIPNPFDPLNLILMPFASWNDSWTVMILDQLDENEKFYIKDMNVTTDNRKIALKNLGETSYVTIYITLCDESYLKEGQKCAPKEIVDQFFTEVSSYIIIDYKFREFDARTKTLTEFYKQNYAIIEPDRQYTAMIEVRLSELTYDDGVLFQSEKTQQFPNDYSLSSQTSSTGFSLTRFSTPILFSLSIQVDPILIKQRIVYPKLAEVLASIGSIVSMIFLVQYFIVFLNKLMFDQKIIDEIISTYYPEFPSIVIQRNWLGTITAVTNSKTREQFEVAEFTRWYRWISKQAVQKMNYLQLLYEMSRLYFVLRIQAPKSLIQSSHYEGIPIRVMKKRFQSDRTDTVQPENDVEMELTKMEKYSDDDFNLLRGTNMFLTETLVN